MNYKTFKFSQAIAVYFKNTHSEIGFNTYVSQYLSLFISVLHNVFSVSKEDCFKLSAFFCGYYGLSKNKKLKSFDRILHDMNLVTDVYQKSVKMNPENTVLSDPACSISKIFLEISPNEFRMNHKDDLSQLINSFISYFTPIYKEITDNTMIDEFDDTKSFYFDESF